MLFKILLFLLYIYHTTSTLTKSCTGHDGCKNEEWIGSYEVTCNGGERICHNTVLKCGRDNCKYHKSSTVPKVINNSVQEGCKIIIKILDSID